MDYSILVVDDEPDMFTITQMALRGLRFEGQAVALHVAQSAAEARDFLIANPDTAVVLLDVVMESDDAGLKWCDWLRHEQNNGLTRIILRTGQPGMAPERKAIDDYEIDGYLAKAEMTQTRLYSVVKTALKTYSELQLAQRLEYSLNRLHHVSLQWHRSLETSRELLQSIVDTARSIAQAPLALLSIEQETSQHLLYACQEPDFLDEARIEQIIQESKQAKPDLSGMMIKIPLDSGEGWLYLDSPFQDDMVAQKVLPMLAEHAAVAIPDRRP